MAGALYQPIGARDQRPRGYLLDDVDADRGDIVRPDRLDAGEADDLLAEVLRKASEAVDELRAGKVVPRPGECGYRDAMCAPVDLPVHAVSAAVDRTLLEDAAGRPIGPGGTTLTREQARVVLEREGPLMVAANAGSGKTTVLVERFVRHVIDDDLDPRAILAITFTRRAAGQLRERIRARFMQLGCTEHARAMEGAWISTIDGFCLRVLRSHAVVAGLDPQLTVLDPGELRPLRERAWEDALAGILGRPGTPPPRGHSGNPRPVRLRAAARHRMRPLRRAAQRRAERAVAARPGRADAAGGGVPAGARGARRAARRIRRGVHRRQARAARPRLRRPRVATRDLLLARPEIARGYAERLQRVLVDEFQDTNRLQVDLLNAIGQEQMFLVGDRLQSIYAFRHADVSGFEREWLRHEAAGTARALATNFRSDPAILELINAALGPQQENFAPLEPGKDASPAGAPVVEVLLTDADAWRAIPKEDPLVTGLEHGMPEGTPIQVQAEARLVAQRARGLLDDGWKAGEIVVLLRAGTHMAAYERALELALVPAVATQGRGWWSRREVQDLLNHLRVLVNPLDEVALVGALASPFAGLGTDDLARLALERRRSADSTLWDMVTAVAGGGGDGLLARLGAPQRERIRAYVALVDRERRAGAGTGPAEVLERVVVETGYDVHVVQGPGGLRRLANVRKLVGMADAFAARSGPDLRAFADHAAAELDAGVPTPDAPLEVGADEAVRLMTIHGAKGLEFPAVIVADLGRDGGGGTPPVIVRDGRVGLRLPRVDDGEPEFAFDYAELDLERTEAEAREERRIMHVAVTRAERLLILSGTFRATKGWGEPGYRKPALAWMGPGLFAEGGDFPPRPGRVRSGDSEASVVLNEPGGVLVLPDPPQAAAEVPVVSGPGDAAGAAPALPAPAGPPPPATLSYSSLTDHARCGYRWYLRRVLRLPEQAAGALGTSGGFSDAARRRGSIAHAVLERVDLADGAAGPDDAAVRAAATAIGEPLEDADIPDQLELAAGFLTGPWRDRAAAATSVRREVGFALPLDPGADDSPMLNGVIDLLAEEADGGVLVIDHKSDHIAPGTDLEGLVARDYAIQRAVYALAALRGGATRVEVAHVYLQTGGAASAVYGPEDVPALQGLISAASAALLTGEYPVTDEPHAGICATCPGRGGLCSAPAALTDRPRPQSP